MLRDQGEPSRINRIYRLYREEGLTVRRRKSRRRAIGTRAPILVEAKVNARWSLDFVHERNPELGERLSCRVALHRSRQADAERLHRILQWANA